VLNSISRYDRRLDYLLFEAKADPLREKAGAYFGPVPLKPSGKTARASRVAHNLRRLAAGTLLRPHRNVGALGRVVHRSPYWSFWRGHLRG
jgi:hypothetical protein